MINKETFLFDGATGTYLAHQYQVQIKQCEYANLEHPLVVQNVHRDYIEAGVNAVKTNTFAANTFSLNTTFDNVEEIIRKGCEIAENAVVDRPVTIFASIGPMPCDDRVKMLAEYEKIIRVFFDCGINHFLFETFNEYEILTDLAKMVKSISRDSYVITECTVAADGYTLSGISAQTIIHKLSAEQDIDACGFNCTCGPMHLLDIVKNLRLHEKPISIMPNAGYPTVISGRTIFETTPDYFADKLMQIRDCGVKFIGGCCGTTPSHIRKVRERLDQSIEKGEVKKDKANIVVKAPTQKQKKQEKSKIIAVELDSPFHADLTNFIDYAKRIYQTGADYITIADCPIGRARADSSMLAAKLKREYHIEALPHLTCRDRNLNATKALLLGLNAEDVTNVLVVTGDPIPSADRDEIKSVFNFNSVKLASYINDLNEVVFEEKPFRIMGALNVNANNFTAELEKAKRKENAGVSAFLTQPVYTEQALENLRMAKGALSAKVLGGVMPIVSYRNACFINNEISGITIPDDIVERYRDLPPEEAAKIAVEISCSFAEQIDGVADGIYLITPLNKVEIICNILKNVRK